MKRLSIFILSLISFTSLASNNYLAQKSIPQTTTYNINHHAIAVVLYPHAAAFESALKQARSLDPRIGLAFDARQLKPVRVSIANSKIPLDILFINAQKRITCMSQEITSNSSSTVGCNTPAVHTVLVLRGGAVQQFQLQIGDKVEGLV